MSPQDDKKRRTSTHFAFMDVANVVACLAVVMLHGANIVFANQGDAQWQRCVIVQSTFVFAVPFFLMISGANLLGYHARYSTADFFKKRASRILGVFVGCSVLFYLVQCFLPLPFGYQPRPGSLGDFVRAFLANDINDVYWYFYAIIGLYLVTPVLSHLADKPRLLGYAIVVCVAVTIVLPLVDRFAPWPHATATLQFPYLSSWLTYYLLGYYLVHHFNRRIHPVVLVVVFAAMVAATAYMTIHTNDAVRVPGGNTPYDAFYANTFGPFEFLGICALFLLFKQGEGLFSKGPVPRVAHALSALSLGIYAIHMLPLRYLDVMVPTWHDSLLWKPLAVFAISALVVWLFRLIVKGVKKLASPNREAKRS